MNQLIKKQYLLYWIAIPFLYKLFSLAFNWAFEIELSGKIRMFGYYEIGIIMMSILFLISLGYLLLDIKNKRLGKKSIIWTLFNIIITFLIVNYTIQNGIINSPYLFTEENAVVRDHGFVEMLNYISIIFLGVWLFIQLIMTYWIIAKFRNQ